jgi:putative peptidoglycan lipid II flippase
MSERRALASGDVLAHRYELQDLVSEKLGSATWRAHDQTLNRNVGIEVLPSSDARAAHFLDAARQSTAVTDPRFLRVLDLIPDEQAHHLVVREWARAFPLDQVLLQSSLPNRRAATVVAEVAEALAHAHENGVFHRRLSPHQVLLKQSGAVRVVGLGVATALAPAGHHDSAADLVAHEHEDVEGLGRLLYACLTSRWPGGPADGLEPAPTEHGRLLRPRQVRAGVSRDIDSVCDRILGMPPRDHLPRLITAADIARTLRLSGEDEDLHDDQPSLTGASSPDLLRLDPVIVPQGPPPGLEPPRRRPKAYDPAPPSTFRRVAARGRRATRGDRALVVLGVAGALALATTLALLVRDSSQSPADRIDDSSPVRVLPIRSAVDFDPQGTDGEENPEDAPLVIDGEPDTGWSTTTYFGRADLGGLKDGVGVLLDLGGARQVSSLRVLLGDGPTDVSILVAPDDATDVPDRVADLDRAAVVEAAGADATISLPDAVVTRYLVVWLTQLPEVDEGDYRGEIREITIRGRG